MLTAIRYLGRWGGNTELAEAEGKHHVDWLHNYFYSIVFFDPALEYDISQTEQFIIFRWNYNPSICQLKFLHFKKFVSL